MRPRGAPCTRRTWLGVGVGVGVGVGIGVALRVPDVFGGKLVSVPDVPGSRLRGVSMASRVYGLTTTTTITTTITATITATTTVPLLRGYGDAL